MVAVLTLTELCTLWPFVVSSRGLMMRFCLVIAFSVGVGEGLARSKDLGHSSGFVGLLRCMLLEAMKLIAVRCGAVRVCVVYE